MLGNFMKRLINLLLLLLFYNICFGQDTTDTKLAVVLSGGGLRGLGHVGVLRALEEKNIKIDLLVGSSIGAVIGGLYAAGYSVDEIEKNIKNVNWSEIYFDEPNRSELFLTKKNLTEKAIVEVRFSEGRPKIPKAFSSGQKMRSLLTKMVLQSPYGNRQDFDNYKIPLRIVATNFLTGEREIFRTGDLAAVIQGSVAVPLLYDPVEIDSMLIVDSGLSDNLPIDVAKACGAEFIIASDLSSPLRSEEDLEVPWEIADQVIGIMMKNRLAKKKKTADILISPDLGQQTPGDWSNISGSIETSYLAAKMAIEKNAKLLENFSSKKQSSFYQFKDIRISKRLFPDFGFRLSFSTGIVLDESIKAEIIYFVDSLQASPLDINDPDLIIKQILMKNKFPFVDTQYLLENDSLYLTLINATIRNIEISGLQKTAPIIVKRELDVESGKSIEYRDLISSYNNIYNSDLFQKVGMNLVQVDSQNQYDLKIKVKEKASTMLRFGLRFDNTRFAKSFVELADENIFGYAIQSAFLFEIGEMDRTIQLEFNSDRIAYSDFTAGGKLYRLFRTRRRYEKDVEQILYDDIRGGFGLHIGLQIERFGQVLVWGIVEELRANYESIYNTKTYLFSKLRFSSTADKRDSRVYPESGIFNEWALDFGHFETGGQSREFVKFNLQLSEWYQLHEYHGIGGLFQNGLADSNIPYEEYFEWGGWDKMPGFVDREYAGISFWLLRLDYRFNIPIDFPGKYYFHLAVAGGKSSLTTETYLKFDNIVYGVLTGVSVQTFFGPIQLFYGYNDTHNERIYVNIGFPF